MARQPYTNRDEVELDLLAFELMERRVALVCKVVLLAVLLVIALVSTGIAIICVLHGYSWPIPSIMGGSGVALGAALAIESRREKQWDARRRR